jgi:hypothetical protein
MILTERDQPVDLRQEELVEWLRSCNEKDRETALQLLATYLRSL